MELKKFFKSELIFADMMVNNKEEFFENISRKANSIGYVTDDFEINVKKREETFPTGIQLEEFAIAIPHTDSEYVKDEFIAVATFKEPVKFSSMEDANAVLDVKMAFMLGLNKPHSQLEVLTQLMTLIQDKEVVSKLIAAETKENLETLLKEV